ncbi:hypothetical protein [Bowdeniella massiliensis]|uniref:hypothetical protein n=1 Tax=Bowdeniella massiliensis TaxID=2932264 RepID=UPI002028CFFA|nr:hypothetical protein [Bowdeniella massiliensis]
MSFLVDLALDLVGDAFISKPSQRKRRMRKLKACAADVARGDLPALNPETPATGAIQPGSIAWAKLPAIKPVVVLAIAGQTVAALVDPATPGAIRLEHLAQFDVLKNRNAVDIPHLKKLPADQLYSEGKQLRRSDFQLVAAALGYPTGEGRS